MRVKYLIEQLKEYDPDDELIVAYWDRNHVAMNLDCEINDDQWLKIIKVATGILDNMDWWGDIRCVAKDVLDKVAVDDIV